MTWLAGSGVFNVASKLFNMFKNKNVFINNDLLCMYVCVM